MTPSTHSPNKGPDAACLKTAPGRGNANGLQVGVAGAQHGAETGGLFLAATALTGFFKMPVAADLLQRAFAVDFLLQPPERAIHRFAFFKPDLGQLKFTSFPEPCAVNGGFIADGASATGGRR